MKKQVQIKLIDDMVSTFYCYETKLPRERFATYPNLLFSTHDDLLRH